VKARVAIVRIGLQRQLYTSYGVEKTGGRKRPLTNKKRKINVDIAKKKRNTCGVLRGGRCFQFTPHRRWVLLSIGAAYHQPLQDSFLNAQVM
jgi:hypothetical protein